MPNQTKHDDPLVTTRRIYGALALLVVVAFLVIVWPLHEGVRISSGAQRQLYDQTVTLIQAQERYAVAHQGQYAPSTLDLASAYADLNYVMGVDSPVIQFTTDSNSHGFYTELADQSNGGAASFTVLLPADGTPQLTCVGPGPLCHNGKFRFPARIDATLNADQRTLYDQTVAVIGAEERYATLNHSYASTTLALATLDPGVAYAATSTTPVTTITTDPSNLGLDLILAGLSKAGEATFSVLIPDHGHAVLSCTGSAPLCSNGTFKLKKPLSSGA